MKALIVTEPFASYAKGDQITAPDKIEAAQASNPHSVVAVELPEPEPVKAPTRVDPKAE
jgi:hypothetical protein